MSRDLGEVLVGLGAISEEQLRAARAVVTQRSLPLARVLLEQNVADESTIIRAQAKLARLPFVDLAGRTPPERITALLDASAAWELEAMPVAEKDGSVIVAVGDPEKAVVMDTLGFLLDRPVTLALAAPTALRKAMERAYGAVVKPGSVAARAAGEAAAEEAPLVRLVHRTFDEAVNQRASDIHIEPFADRVRIRLRIDGGLKILAEHPPEVFAPLVSHLKVTAGLDIAEKRRPQDGRIAYKAANRDLDVRVSVLPTNHGEGVVMRLLDREANLISLAQLGLSPSALRWSSEVIERPSGIFLVTGPTGSGKTTTLYAALQTLNRPDRKILTVEDPVEYRIRGINQVQVHPTIGLNFSRVLRAFLRQAPNVVLVGEIRDRETAEVAIQASLTGHIVFSTVHTNDAPSAVTRLLDMGVPPFLIATSLQGVLAQRLVRRVCPECSAEAPADAIERRVLNLPDGALLKRGRGCRNCNGTGTRGRIGVYEWLDLDDSLRETLFHSAEGSAFVAAAQRSSRYRPLIEDAIEKVKAGLTTVPELLRITKVKSESTTSAEDKAASAPAAPAPGTP